MHRGKKYNLVRILHIGRESSTNLVNRLCIREGKTILCKSCPYIAHWRKKYNLAHILHIWRESCAYISHGRNNYHLAQILRIYCTSGKEVQSCTNLVPILCIGRESCTNPSHILLIGEITTILNKSCAYIAHWRNKYNLEHILHIYCALEREVQSCAYIAHLERILRIYFTWEK